MSETPTPNGAEDNQPEREPGRRPRIWAASLSDYNAGRLHGCWIDADQQPEQLHAAVQTMLAASPGPMAEEWAIHDYEGFGPLALSEYESLDTVATIALGIAEHGPAFAAWAAYVGTSQPEELTLFEGAYWGEWTSLEAYAEELFDELGFQAEVDKLPEWLSAYLTVDYAAFARDFANDLHVAEHADGVWIFDTT